MRFTLPFRFKLDAAAEVYRDPLGHYHHWTVLSGHLVEGTMRVGNLIKLPLTDGTVFIAHIGDMTKFTRSLGTEITVGQVDQPFTVVVWQPAPRQDDIALSSATDATPEEARHNLLDTLEHHPYRLLHNRGKDAATYDCGACSRAIPHTLETVAILKRLRRTADNYIAQRASAILQKWNSESESQPDFPESWDSAERFYAEHTSSPAWAWLNSIFSLIAALRSQGYDHQFRAGISMWRLIISRSRRVGSHLDQSYLMLSPKPDGGMIISYSETFTSPVETEIDRVELAPELDQLLQRLLTHPIV